MSSSAQKATLVPDPHAEGGVVAVLAVLAGEEAYGFPLSSVREILVPPPVAEVPRSPNHILGVISVRGRIITLIDLPKLLNIAVGEQRSCGRVLLIDNGEELIGVAVDEVIQAIEWNPRRSSTPAPWVPSYLITSSASGVCHRARPPRMTIC